MSDSTIPQAFVLGYSNNLYMLAEQRGTKLSKAVDYENGLIGKKHSKDRMGSATGQKIVNRHGDTPLNEIDSSRRWLSLSDWNTATLIDKLDKPKMLLDPTNPYVMRQGSFFGRVKDTVIVDAILGSAEYGVEGGSYQTFDSGQQIAVASSNLTLEKLRALAELFEGNSFDQDEDPWHIAATASQKRSLLTTTEVTNSDYAAVKALVDGKIDEFLGFKFHWVNGLRPDGTKIIPVDSSTYRRCVAWVESAVWLGVAVDVNVDIGPRRDKNMATQIYSEMSIGAVRMEEHGVAEILCSEASYGTPA